MDSVSDDLERSGLELKYLVTTFPWPKESQIAAIKTEVETPKNSRPYELL